MRLSLASLLTIVATSIMSASANQVNVEVLHLPAKCERKSQKGDTIDVHYRGTLAKDASEFDSSYKRGQPLSFTVGMGQVIKG